MADCSPLFNSLYNKDMAVADNNKDNSKIVTTSFEPQLKVVCNTINSITNNDNNNSNNNGTKLLNKHSGTLQQMNLCQSEFDTMLFILRLLIKLGSKPL